MKVSSWLCLLDGANTNYRSRIRVQSKSWGPTPLIKCLTAKIELLSENSHACTGCKLKARERGFWSFALMTKKMDSPGTVPLELVGLSKISSCWVTLKTHNKTCMFWENKKRAFENKWGHYKMLQEIHNYLAMVNLWELLPSKIWNTRVVYTNKYGYELLRI